MADIFISFLGAGAYYPTRYYLKDDRSDLTGPIYYVQEAILRAQPVVTDRVLIFTTQEAERNNYDNRVYRDGREFKLDQSQGLVRVLDDLKEEGIIETFESIDIPNGYTEAEIWQIFQTVFGQMRAGDEIIFDITFGFRSLPMLAMVLLNYARALRGVRVKAIYYGNFEAGKAEKTRAVRQAKEAGLNSDTVDHLQQKVIEAPIIDLRAFSVLQEWTYAAQSFLQAGNAEPLAELTRPSHPEFSDDINRFTKALLTCRGQALRHDLDIDRLKAQMIELGGKDHLEVQLAPLLEKIQEKLRGFETNQLSNGFAAVRWCIDHGMVQQGITFLQESLISYVVEKAIGPESATHAFYRDIAGGALNEIENGYGRAIKQKHRHGIPLSNSEIGKIYRQAFSFVVSIPGLSDLYKRLTGRDGFRNDINHCGFRDDYKSSQELVADLERLADDIWRLGL